MIKKILNSGIFTFIAGTAIMVIYALISPYKVGTDSSPYPVSVFNVMFTILYLVACCVAAYQYGKRKNISGLIGLICIFVFPFIALYVLSFIKIWAIPMVIFFFSYWTLILIIDLFVLYASPVIMSGLMILFWFIGKRRTKKLEKEVATHAKSEE